MNTIGIKNLIKIEEKRHFQTSEKLMDFLINALKFDENEYLKKAISNLYDSRDVTNDGSQDFYIWTRFDAANIINPSCKLEIEALDRYLAENHIVWDKINDDLLMSLGPCILINSQGDIFDQDLKDRLIIKRSEYPDKEEAIELIKKHMNKTGHYPCVLIEDVYGNIEMLDGV